MAVVLPLGGTGGGERSDGTFTASPREDGSLVFGSGEKVICRPERLYAPGNEVPCFRLGRLETSNRSVHCAPGMLFPYVRCLRRGSRVERNFALGSCFPTFDVYGEDAM